MKTLEYRFYDKANWGQGPWQSEPDKKQWIDEATGLPCLIVRNKLGALCGYVGVPRSHPAYMKNSDDVDVDVHGGLTFSDKCHAGSEHGVCHKVDSGEDDDVWWLGFDCAHCGDAIPKMNADDRARGWSVDASETYKGVDYVAAECASLAKQLRNKSVASQ